VTIIFAQKPNDHSLCGADHIAWIKRKLALYPDAELRHHPLMCAVEQEPLDEALDRCYRAVTFSSTVGGEALIAGCISLPDDEGSMAYTAHSRAKWLHELSWKQFSHTEYHRPDVASWIMSGYEEARASARKGNVQTPRNKVDRNIECLRYYREFGN